MKLLAHRSSLTLLGIAFQQLVLLLEIVFELPRVRWEIQLPQQEKAKEHLFRLYQ
jgi:hypothetical protein